MMTGYNIHDPHTHRHTHLWPDAPNPGTDWMRNAKCATTPITAKNDPFDPVGKSNTKTGLARYAAKVCAGCPVIVQCAQHTLFQPDPGMIRAGVAVPSEWDDEKHLPAVIARLQHIAGISVQVAA